MVFVAGLIPFTHEARSDLGTAPAAVAATVIRITVTTSSDAADGDTSSVGRLLASPGPDGVSLREAIAATNSDPGRYRIGFAPSMTGARIMVGSQTGRSLPPLAGGGVAIDGDIDRDGHPDVTIVRGAELLSTCRLATDPTEQEEPCAFRIASSRNGLHGLGITGFATGVLFTPSPADDPEAAPLPTNRMFTGNEISGLVMRDLERTGIALRWASHGCMGEGEVCESHNSWIDTKLVGNTIESSAYGIHLKLNSSIADRLRALTVTDNTIRIEPSQATERNGIHLEAGLGIGSVENRIEDVLVSRNTITGPATSGITIIAGAIAGDRNVLERIRVLDNTVDVSRAACEGCSGIALGLGENTAKIGWDLPRIHYGDGNAARDIEIAGNTIRGGMQAGIFAGASGGRGNVLEDIRIVGNAIELRGLAAGIKIETGACCDFEGERPPSGNRATGVEIAADRITIRDVGSQDQQGLGGIVLAPGTQDSRAGEISAVRIADNRIDVWNSGINLSGGTWWRKGVLDVSKVSLMPTRNENRLSCAVFRENMVNGTRVEPSVIVDADDPDDLSGVEREAAWTACTWDPRDVDLVAGLRAADATPGDQPAPAEAGSVVLLIAVGALAMLGGFLLLFHRWRSVVRPEKS